MSGLGSTEGGKPAYLNRVGGREGQGARRVSAEYQGWGCCQLMTLKFLASPVKMCLNSCQFSFYFELPVLSLETDISIILIGNISRWYKFHIYLHGKFAKNRKIALMSIQGKRLKCINKLQAEQKIFASFSFCYENGCLRQNEKQVFFFLHLFWSFKVHCYNNTPIQIDYKKMFLIYARSYSSNMFTTG